MQAGTFFSIRRDPSDHKRCLATRDAQVYSTVYSRFVRQNWFKQGQLLRFQTPPFIKIDEKPRARSFFLYSYRCVYWKTRNIAHPSQVFSVTLDFRSSTSPISFAYIRSHSTSCKPYFFSTRWGFACIQNKWLQHLGNLAREEIEFYCAYFSWPDRGHSLLFGTKNIFLTTTFSCIWFVMLYMIVKSMICQISQFSLIGDILVLRESSKPSLKRLRMLMFFIIWIFCYILILFSCNVM